MKKTHNSSILKKTKHTNNQSETALETRQQRRQTKTKKGNKQCREEVTHQQHNRNPKKEEKTHKKKERKSKTKNNKRDDVIMMSFRDDFSRMKTQHASRHTAQHNTGGRDTTYQRQRDRRSTSSCTQILKNKHFILCSLASVNQDDVLDSAWQKEGWV